MPIVHLKEDTHQDLRLLAIQRKKKVGELANEIIASEVKRNKTRQTKKP